MAERIKTSTLPLRNSTAGMVHTNLLIVSMSKMMETVQAAIKDNQDSILILLETAITSKSAQKDDTVSGDSTAVDDQLIVPYPAALLKRQCRDERPGNRICAIG